MKKTLSFFLFLFSLVCMHSQNINGIQLHNPQTNDQTPVIRFGEQLVLRFDDFDNNSNAYRYTLKHYDRNWEEDNLFFTEYAVGSMSAMLDNYEYSFNTHQKYTHYTLKFPNEQLRLKLSGNYKIIVYKDSPEKPLFTRRFSVVEDGAQLGLNVTRFSDARRPNLNQRVEVRAISLNQSVLSNANSITLNVIQNNNWNESVNKQRPSSTLGNKILFQQMDLVFPGNNEFYYFDNKNIIQGFDMVAGGEIINNQNHTYLHPVWAYPSNYQYQPDVNGAYYFRRNDLGIERNADREADYSWVYFILDSDRIEDDIYVLGAFNEYIASETSKMSYNESRKQYVGKIYLKQGFYNYILATKNSNGILDLGNVNGNFWQTENLYQAFLYYQPFGKNYDGLIGYGEYRKARN